MPKPERLLPTSAGKHFFHPWLLCTQLPGPCDFQNIPCDSERVGPRQESRTGTHTLGRSLEACPPFRARSGDRGWVGEIHGCPGDLPPGVERTLLPPLGEF